MGQLIYCFGNGRADGDATQKELLGGKGAGLAGMARQGLPVPPGFTIPTTVCQHYYTHSYTLPKSLNNDVKRGMAHIASAVGRQFGDSATPLLVSVRSGAANSMPGMMETILNLGLNDQTVTGLARSTGNAHFAQDSYARLLHMYKDVVGVSEVPQDPWQQLWGAIEAVFKSWMSKRAIEYRRIHGISEQGGTAVTVQAMVFGNMGERSGTGVAFTRNPSTGERTFFGEFLANAQGEDVVAGIRTPEPIAAMQAQMPKAYGQLVAVAAQLEKNFRDMQDLEFTVENDKLWMLQTRTGKRSSRAAIKIAVDMVDEGLIDRQQAVLRVQPAQIDQILHPMIDPTNKIKPVARGLAASPGAAVGQVVFSADDAVARAHNGEAVVLVRTETSPDDIQGMHVARGFLTARGGMTSHAAVVARGMGKPCVVGCHAMRVIEPEKVAVFAGDVLVREGDWISIDGSTGDVMIGKSELVTPVPDREFGVLMSWADAFRKVKVRANADTPDDAGIARRMGAEGIGLCRTEHMFFAEGRLQRMREMIVARTQDARQAALDALLPMQEADFYGILKSMAGLPVTIRLLDPPLHEFLPTESAQQEELARHLGVQTRDLETAVAELYEMNPMLGHRGCRLAITYPEIYDMQVRAIMMAAVRLVREGVDVHPEIELPLIAHASELKLLRDRIDSVCRDSVQASGVDVAYKVGTMIELPRAAITADRLAAHADFFSFGTNDLTQTTFGLSRDDSSKFLPQYLEAGVLAADPFVSIDEEGVGELMRLAIEKGRRQKPGLEIGICGEHGGDPRSVAFCQALGLDYVSCSPYRIPVARMAAAHAALQTAPCAQLKLATK